MGLDVGHDLQCLRYLRELRRRRKAFERAAENGLGFGVAPGRAVELGERESGAQFEGAGFLVLRDGDGGEQGVFGGIGV